MELRGYFDNTTGLGVLATADKEGRVDAAVYARPYISDDGTAAFIMAERLTHANLQSNPRATYLFVESGEGYSGKRLYLKKIKEEENPDMIKAICRRCDYSGYGDLSGRHIVYFEVEKALPLIGAK
jgi:hypothetical protein